jgi:ribonuclease P protein component
MGAGFWPGAERRAARSSFPDDCAHLICNGAVPQRASNRGGRGGELIRCDDMSRPERLRLPAERRIRRKSEFDAAYAHGQRFGNGFFAVTVYSHPPGCSAEGPRVGEPHPGSPRLGGPSLRGVRPDGPRIGLAVAVRTAGGSVQRNRIRRVIRESFRLHQHELPGADIIVSARARARDAPGPELHAALAALWKKVAGVCAKPPPC